MSRWGGGGVALSALLLAAPADQASPAPLRLAIYYGYPSLVNNAQGDVDRAVAVFADYDAIVFGDGLEFPTLGLGAGPQEHEFTRTLIQRLRLTARRPLIFGYIDLGLSQSLPIDMIVDRIDRWGAMGAGGVFLDEAGFDFGVTRQRQNAAVTAAHARGLSVILNSFRPEDVFSATPTPLNAAGGGNPSGLEPALTAIDAILLESFVVRNGVPETVDALVERTRAAIAGRERFGTRIAAISTAGDARVDSPLMPYAWWVAAVCGLDANGWGTPHFGADASTLPWVPRPEEEATLARAHFLGDLVTDNGRGYRQTTAGTIVVDSTTRQGALALR